MDEPGSDDAKEVADRLTAEPGTKEYGVLSIMLAYYANVTTALKVSRTAFNPAPNVDSAVVLLTPKQPDQPVEKPDQLFSLVKAAFAHRRKSLWNNLLQKFGKDEKIKERLTRALDQSKIEPGIRAERLTLNQLTDLYLALMEENFYR